MKRVMVELRHKLKLNNQGSTMMETLVSFVVLMIVLAALYTMVHFAMELKMRADDSARVRATFNAEVYKENPANNVKIIEYKGISAGDNKTMFTLKLSEETNPKNINIDYDGNSWEDIPDADKADITKSIRLPRIDATGYVSTDPLVSSEKIATPKVLMFRYNHTYVNLPNTNND